MTAIHNAIINLKQYLVELSLVLTISSLSAFDKIMYAIKNELNEVLIGHIIVGAICTLIIRIIVLVFGRWIGEEIDEMSDIEFMKRYDCQYNVFEKLTDIRTHGLLYTPNYDYDVYDRNKIKVYSNVLGIHSTETFEFTHTAKTVSLRNIHGSYQSSVSYEWDGSGIVAQWIVKPKGFRRAFALVFGKKAAKNIKADFQKFVDKNKL